MIIGKIHPGSGLGDQLFSYIITRVIALDKGYDFGFVGKEFFKGKDFMNLDWGKEVDWLTYDVEHPTGALKFRSSKRTIPKEFIFNKPYYDPEVNFIEDGTVIDGYGAQDERYWGHRVSQISEWLGTDSLQYNAVPQYKRTCIINFRGGEYQTVPELFLSQEYWDSAINFMKEKYSDIEFIVHTDDAVTAKRFFPDFEIITGIDINWGAIRSAQHLILSNSAFGILPAILNPLAEDVIAPKYWAGRNVGEWRRPQNYYKGWTYI